MSRAGMLKSLIETKEYWDLRPPEVKKNAVIAKADAIVAADHLWVDLNAFGAKDIPTLTTLKESDPAAFEHCVTNFWTGVWYVLNAKPKGGVE